MVTKILKRIVVSAFFLVTISFSLRSQTVDLPKSIVISNHPDFGLASYYEVKKGNTIYSICKAYHVDVSKLKRINWPRDINSLQPGDTLIIPFNAKLVDTKNTDFPIEKFIPIYYETAPKDNIFRIARIYFDQSIEQIMSRNKLNDFDLVPGQLVLIGWKRNEMRNTEFSDHHRKLDSVAEDEKISFVQRIDSKSDIHLHDTDSVKITTIVEQQVVQENGLAIWNKESNASGVFALHNSAKAGTLLEVGNPVLNRKTFVKVIGQIPDNSYPENVKLILSPEAAKLLGVLDARFYVKMTYIKG